MLPTKIRFIWPTGFRGDFKKSTNPKQNCQWWPCLLSDWDEMNNLLEELLYMLPTKLQLLWLSGFRREVF